jgi:hypothetical protein
MSTPERTPQKTSSSPTSNASGTLPERREEALPAAPGLTGLTKDEGAAPRSIVRASILKVAYLMEPDMSSERLQALVAYVADQDWSQAELAHAADRLPRDQRLDEKIRYGGRLTPADFERVIEGAKEVAETIKKPLTARQMERAIELEPQLTRPDFTRQNRPHDDEDRWLLDDEPLEDLFGMDRSRGSNRDE